MKQKKAIENRTPVYLCLNHEFCKKIHFGAFLMLCCQVSKIFTIFFRGSEVCLERCESYGDLGYLKKSNIFILREICKRTYCPPLVTPVLLLFVKIGESVLS